MLCFAPSQCLLEYVLHWLCVYATHSEEQISAMVLESATQAAEPVHIHSAPPHSNDSSGKGDDSAVPAVVSSRRVPSMSQLLDWLSLLCDTQVGLLSASRSDSHEMSTASRLVRCVRYLVSAHFHPAANSAKHCHALAKAIQQHQQQSGRGRQRTVQHSKSIPDAALTAYHVEYVTL